VDFGLLFSLTEVAHVWYVASTACGALAGAIANFLLNRHWSFEANEGAVNQQARRYALVSAGSLILNTFGVWGVTVLFKIHYAISVVAVALLVGFFFNFPLQRGYVFR